MRSISALGCVIAFIAISAHAQGGFRPKAGFVPNEKVALQVGRAVLAEIYGEKQIQSEEPFSAKLHAGIWTVMGTLAQGIAGGVAEVRISKRDGTIFSVQHGK